MGFTNMVVYLDDYFIVEDSYEKCRLAQITLIKLLIQLGFQISWKKVVSPSQKIEFLGVLFDSSCCTASLSQSKLAALYEKLEGFRHKTRASKRQLQSLAGSLNWACQVIVGGRYFLRRILDSLQCLKLASHKCKLSVQFHKDLEWWLDYCATFNGMVYQKHSHQQAMHTDACNEGAGVFFKGQWYYINWAGDFPNISKLHINYKEVMAIILGLELFAPSLANSEVTVVTDNTAAKGILNKGRSRNKFVMSWLRRLFWLCTYFNIAFRVIHLPGTLNQIPDAVSRLHEPGQILRLYSLMCDWSHASQVKFIVMFLLNDGSWVSGGLPPSPAVALQTELDREVAVYRAANYAESTKRAYSTHKKMYYEFCGKVGAQPIPASTNTIVQYAAFLARRMKPASVR